jgi:hypothetical protein
LAGGDSWRHKDELLLRARSEPLAGDVSVVVIMSRHDSTAGDSSLDEMEERLGVVRMLAAVPAGSWPPKWTLLPL